MSSRRRAARWCGGVGVLLSVPACGDTRASTAEVEAYRALRGELTAAETSAALPHGRYARQRVRLWSGTGLAATGWLLRPAADTGCFPAVLLQDGREENSDVVGRLPADFGDVVVLALDYPGEIPYEIQVGDVVQHGDRLQRAARRIPALFLLGVEYLSRRADVDTGRMAIAATSFAVPFATIAAAADPRVRNVALVYGAGDMSGVLAANLRTRPAALREPLAWMAMRPFAALAPERFAGRISPRLLVMVNGVDDPQMPRAAVQRLYDAARPPRELVWLRTGHLMPTDSALIRTLVDTAFARLPVLRRAGGTGACAVPPRA